MSPAPALDPKIVSHMLREGIPHCREMGIEAISVTPESTILRLPYQDRLVGNPDSGVLHGGVITTLVDTVCGMAVHMALGKLLAIATLDLRIDYLRPATARVDLFASAHCFKLTRHIAFTRATAYNEDPDDPVAHCVGTFMIASSDKPVMDKAVLREVMGS